MRITVRQLRRLVYEAVTSPVDPVGEDITHLRGDDDEIPLASHLLEPSQDPEECIGPVAARNRRDGLLNMFYVTPDTLHYNAWSLFSVMKTTLRELREIISEALELNEKKGHKKKKKGKGGALRKHRHRVGRHRKDPSSPLASYIDAHADASIDIAGKFGLEPQTLDKYARGDGVPSLATAEKIEKKTNGAVPIDTWLLFDGPPKALGAHEMRSPWYPMAHRLGGTEGFET